MKKREERTLTKLVHFHSFIHSFFDKKKSLIFCRPKLDWIDDKEGQLLRPQLVGSIVCGAFDGEGLGRLACHLCSLADLLEDLLPR